MNLMEPERASKRAPPSSSTRTRLLPSAAQRTQKPPVTRSACACGGGCPRCAGRTHDYEKHAHDTAQTVNAGHAHHSALSTRQHARPQGESEPLDTSVRHDMEDRFGASFADVRVHRRSAAAESAQSVNARAFTAGAHDLVFHPGEYQPHTSSGRRLIAHELTHILHQRSDPTAPRVLKQSHTDIGPGEEPVQLRHARAVSQLIRSASLADIGQIEQALYTSFPSYDRVSGIPADVHIGSSTYRLDVSQLGALATAATRHRQALETETTPPLWTLAPLAVMGGLAAAGGAVALAGEIGAGSAVAGAARAAPVVARTALAAARPAAVRATVGVAQNPGATVEAVDIVGGALASSGLSVQTLLSMGLGGAMWGLRNVNLPVSGWLGRGAGGPGAPGGGGAMPPSGGTPAPGPLTPPERGHRTPATAGAPPIPTPQRPRLDIAGAPVVAPVPEPEPGPLNIDPGGAGYNISFSRGAPPLRTPARSIQTVPTRDTIPDNPATAQTWIGSPPPQRRPARAAVNQNAVGTDPAMEVLSAPAAPVPQQTDFIPVNRSQAAANTTWGSRPYTDRPYGNWLAYVERFWQDTGRVGATPPPYGYRIGTLRVLYLPNQQLPNAENLPPTPASFAELRAARAAAQAAQAAAPATPPPAPPAAGRMFRNTIVNPPVPMGGAQQALARWNLLRPPTPQSPVSYSGGFQLPASEAHYEQLWRSAGGIGPPPPFGFTTSDGWVFSFSFWNARPRLGL